MVMVGNLNKLTNVLRVFDPSRLLVIRVGNLNKLTNEKLNKEWSSSWEPFVLFIESGVQVFRCYTVYI